ncbi:MAG: prepilin-type N-terminal cleavage/methylation domain-containing protein [Planctomycetes bacterium]|nr:prepilin-type N-terminal cleavage/methylation domain-containing protein [Planctomycetota bacterium]
MHIIIAARRKLRPTRLAPVALGCASRAHISRRTAFSFVEIVVVLVILGVMAGIAVPRFSNAIARRRADSAATRIVMDLALARHHARVISADVTVTFAPQPAYAMDNVPDPNLPSSLYSVDLNTAPYHVTNWLLNFGGAKKVTFDMYGTPNRGGSIVIYVGNEARTISIDQDTGKANSSDGLLFEAVNTTGFPVV